MECRHHPTCPGCPYMGHAYADQLERKQARLQAAFADYPHLPKVGPVAPATHTEAYRHRLKLPLATAKGNLRIGLYDRSGESVLDTPDCPVLVPELREALPPLLEGLKGIRGLHSLDLRVSRATGELMAVLACADGHLHGGGETARKLMRKIPKLASFSVSTADRDRKKVMGSRAQLLAGKERLREQIGRTEVQIFPGAFFQVDPRNAAQLHERVAAYVGSARRILDLYAGVGAYGLMLAPGREKVVVIEEVGAACAAARAAAPPQVQVIHGKVEDQDLARLGPFDAVILNPARRGSDPHSLAMVARLAPKVVYVSCGPETLARDLDCLAAHGLRVKEVAPLDLFPQTPEVEAVVCLERGPALQQFEVPGGRAQGPWLGNEGPTGSGALGRPSRALALVIGDPGETGQLPGGRFRRIGIVATHALIRIDVEGGRLMPCLSALARAGHPVAGRHAPTDRFFGEKAGLLRPFLHIERAGTATAPLHGDLRHALRALGAHPRILERAGA